MSLSHGFRALSFCALAVTLLACDADPLASPPDADASRTGVAVAASPSAMAALGREIFFDRSLSLHENQACAACHSPDWGFTGPTAGINQRGAVYMGSVRYRSGNRKPPSAAYASLSPQLYWDASDEVWVGGNFWDGRATGWVLGNPAADQALGPFLNPAEQALPGAICVLYRIASGRYADLWVDAFDDDLRDMDFPADIAEACRTEGPVEFPPALAPAVEENYGKVGLAVAAFEASPEVNAFSSKFDAVMDGRAEFTEQEAMGLALFNGKGGCGACHPTEGEGGAPGLLTDFTYDNLGIPANPLNPIYETDPSFVDLGLGFFLANSTVGQALAQAAGVDPMDFYGAVKVPTLRNVARTPGGSPKAYGHNGVFKSLEQIVHFYNTRDVVRQCDPGEVASTPAGLMQMGYEPECWPAPEVAENVNREELGHLMLTAAEERAIVAFMRTLSDGWTPRGGHP